MVLTQPGKTPESFQPLFPFPYHYGSYATKSLSPLYRIFFTVSIPLWFLRNYGKL